MHRSLSWLEHRWAAATARAAETDAIAVRWWVPDGVDQAAVSAIAERLGLRYGNGFVEGPL